mmetsp:Transcript_50520/g.141446  ORF Transcript_50520/g.141446 Transcript_50520/m.141446 type:complete len:221 (-) Transcript_50520:2194-2856(-)
MHPCRFAACPDEQHQRRAPSVNPQHSMWCRSQPSRQGPETRRPAVAVSVWRLPLDPPQPPTAPERCATMRRSNSSRNARRLPWCLPRASVQAPETFRPRRGVPPTTPGPKPPCLRPRTLAFEPPRPTPRQQHLSSSAASLRPRPSRPLAWRRHRPVHILNSSLGWPATSYPKVLETTSRNAAAASGVEPRTSTSEARTCGRRAVPHPPRRSLPLALAVSG